MWFLMSVQLLIVCGIMFGLQKLSWFCPKYSFYSAGQSKTPVGSLKYPPEFSESFTRSGLFSVSPELYSSLIVRPCCQFLEEYVF